MNSLDDIADDLSKKPVQVLAREYCDLAIRVDNAAREVDKACKRFRLLPGQREALVAIVRGIAP